MKVQGRGDRNPLLFHGDTDRIQQPVCTKLCKVEPVQSIPNVQNYCLSVQVQRIRRFKGGVRFPLFESCKLFDQKRAKRSKVRPPSVAMVQTKVKPILL